ERDIFHWFADKTCTTCHIAGGPPDSPPATDHTLRQDSSGNVYHPIWQGTVQEAYDNLTKPVQDDCDGTHVTLFKRICLAAPEKSLLYLFPTQDATGVTTRHPGITNLNPATDAFPIAVLKWLQDGALLR